MPGEQKNFFRFAIMTEAELKLKEAIKESAKRDLDGWYEKRATSIEARRAMNRANETESNDSRNGSINESGKYVKFISQVVALLSVIGRESQI